MTGRFARRNPAMVTLSNEHVAMLDAIALVHYGVPRTRMVAALIDRALPGLIAELRKRDPDRMKEIDDMAAQLRLHVEQPHLPVGVVDLAQRRHERIQRKKRGL